MRVREERHRAAAIWLVACLGAALRGAPALGQMDAEPLVPRVAGPVIQAVALEGDHVGSGRIQFIGPGQMDRQGDIAFEGQMEQRGQLHWGLFAWSGGAVTTLALEGQETGQGPLVLTDPLLAFREWVWGDGSRALFVAAVDANRNGVFDAGVDPQFLFLAGGGRLTPLLRFGQPLDGGTLLSVLSFRVNGLGQVAFQALIDRDGDGQYTAEVDFRGFYLLDNGRVRALVREGDRVGDSVVHRLDIGADSGWEFNDRAEALITTVELEPPGTPPLGGFGQFLASPTGIRLLARPGLPTPFGTFYSAPFASLNDNGDVVFSADVLPEDPFQELPWRIYRVRSADQPNSRLEVLAQPGDEGLDGTPILELGASNYPTVPIADNGTVAFSAFYDQGIPLGEGEIDYPAVLFVRTSDRQYEVTRAGYSSPWGVTGGISRIILNDYDQAAVEIRAAMYPFDPVFGPGAGPVAILFWENGTHIGVVGPGDLIPGGQVIADSDLIGLSNNGRLAFRTTVTDDQGAWRNGIYVALVPSGH